MASRIILSRDPRRAALTGLAVLAIGACALVGGKALLAQIAGDRGIAADHLREPGTPERCAAAAPSAPA